MPPKQKKKPTTNFWERSSSYKKQKLLGEVGALNTLKENISESINEMNESIHEMETIQDANSDLLSENNELLEKKTRLETEITKLQAIFEKRRATS